MGETTRLCGHLLSGLIQVHKTGGKAAQQCRKLHPPLGFPETW